MNLLKCFIFSFFIFTQTLTFGQDNFIKISIFNGIVDKNIVLENLMEKYGYDYKVENFTFDFSLKVISRKKNCFLMGLSYKKIQSKIIDRITHWNYTTYHFGTGLYTYYTINQVYQDPADLISNYHNFGLNNEFIYKLKNHKNFQNDIGIKSEIYLFEFFNSHFYTKDIALKNSENPTYSSSMDYSLINSSSKPFTKYYENKNQLFLSLVNLSLFYRLSYCVNEKFSLATKISLGTNLYSDWDQFKKYAWLGVGLEMGFGKKKVKEPKVE